MPNRKKIRARARMYFFFTVMREEAFDNEELTHFPGLKLPLPSPVRGLAKNSCRGYIDSSAEAYRYRCGAWSSKPVDGREAVGRFDSYTPPPLLDFFMSSPKKSLLIFFIFQPYFQPL